MFEHPIGQLGLMLPRHPSFAFCVSPELEPEVILQQCSQSEAKGRLAYRASQVVSHSFLQRWTSIGLWFAGGYAHVQQILVAPAQTAVSGNFGQAFIKPPTINTCGQSMFIEKIENLRRLD